MCIRDSMKTPCRACGQTAGVISIGATRIARGQTTGVTMSATGGAAGHEALGMRAGNQSK
eukprot:66119-Lingulodinium_polyedra.AAC.1